MSSTNRHHTVVVATDKDGHNSITFEKDWYSYEWASLFSRRMIVETKYGTFHIVGERYVFSPADAARLVGEIIAGKTRTIDLQEMSVKHYGKGRK